ncbi:response regulator transcription factor [Mesorhizobium neociceri]|uniref:Response regulator n=1 Tax=Mesorhizobium neociceri TaxID=1307853 RepID=A0A838AW01_9HYPH|nr:response regulator [Mesorhizobium neociceri]MBA1138668.1 response regulator [Mesorhizobium neociceri]
MIGATRKKAHPCDCAGPLTRPGRSDVLKQPATICIVDDDRDVRLSLKSYLRAAGMDVRTFGSAESFLKSPDRAETDCLVTDLHMPGLDGLGLQQELNRIGRNFPVVVMTAFPTMAAEAESAQLGAAAFLEKPIDPDALLEKVEAVLPRRRARRRVGPRDGILR